MFPRFQVLASSWVALLSPGAILHLRRRKPEIQNAAHWRALQNALNRWGPGSPTLRAEDDHCEFVKRVIAQALTSSKAKPPCCPDKPSSDAGGTRFRSKAGMLFHVSSTPKRSVV